MHIIQLTDIHLSLEGESPHGVDVRKNFLNALSAISDLAPDLLVISGDLCFDIGVGKIYDWIREQLELLKFPYYVIPGNHDDPQLMIDHFKLEESSENGQLFYALEGYPQHLLFLDTSNYTLPDLQIKWLKQQLLNRDGPICLFMHHPPAKMDTPYMDENHHLINMNEVQEILTEYPHPITIFTGHYHVDKSLRIKNLDIHITPSTFFQIDWRQPIFEVDHYRCGFRSIKLNEQQIIHSVIYFS